jgi:anaerobic magnesium-protoporphyrin IX monomethyl ester cyclase
MQDLDALPFPAWDLVDVQAYRRIWYARHGYYSVNMVTTRGCPYHCNWCAKPIWGQRYNVRSPENVLQEMVWLKNNFQPDHIWFADDIIGLKPGWMQAFAELVDQLNISIPFKSLSRADLLLVDDTVAAFQRAGCRTVWIGAESGSQAILDAMEKGISVQQIYQATQRLHDAGIKVAFFIQFGYPGESLQDIEHTLQMIRDCRPDDIGISVSYPLPGTKFYERVKEQLVGKQNWQDSDDLAMLYQGPFSTAFYRKLHTVVHKEFRTNKFLSEVRQALTQPASLRLLHAKRLLLACYYRMTLPFARLQLRLSEKAGHQPTVLAESSS